MFLLCEQLITFQASYKQIVFAQCMHPQHATLLLLCVPDCVFAVHVARAAGLVLLLWWLQGLNLALQCLSFDFVGTCLDDSSEELCTIQARGRARGCIGFGVAGGGRVGLWWRDKVERIQSDWKLLLTARFAWHDAAVEQE